MKGAPERILERCSTIVVDGLTGRQFVAAHPHTGDCDCGVVVYHCAHPVLCVQTQTEVHCADGRRQSVPQSQETCHLSGRIRRKTSLCESPTAHITQRETSSTAR